MIQDNNEDSSVKNHNLMHIGDYLRHRREEMRLSLDKVSQKTKININLLRSLEANDFSKLPSPAYVKGFVLSYARIIGLRQDDVINKLEYSYLTLMGKPFPALNHTRNFHETTPVQTTEKEVGHDPAKILEETDSNTQIRKRIVPAAILISIVLLVGLTYRLAVHTVEQEAGESSRKLPGPTFVPSSELVHMNEPAKPVEEKKEDVKAAEQAASEEAKPASSEQPVSTDGVDSKPAEKVETAHRNFPNVEFRPIRGKLFSIINDAKENSDEAIFPSRVREAFNKEMQNVYIHAVDGNTWLSYKVDESPIESAIIEKGKDLYLQGKEILIFLGNVRVTRIFYNNHLIDTPTRTGLKSLIFPEDANKAHVLPLFPKAEDDILYTAKEYQRRMKIEEDESNKKVEN